MREKLEVIVPVYNEEECLDKIIERLTSFRESISCELDTDFIFVDDGSSDKSYEILKKYANTNTHIKVIRFSRNFGHQFAVTAGLDYSSADYVAIIDADLQDPPELIKDMYEKTKEGYQIVYGTRLKRKKETLFKKVTAYSFYRIFNFLSQINLPKDTGDFRLMTKDVVNILKKMPEKHRFLRGMIAWVGFNSTPLYYDRDERFAGNTKYSLSKMLKLAYSGLISFSTYPTKLIFIIAFLLFFLSLSFMFVELFLPNKFQNIKIFSVIIFVGALQIFCTGIIGEYIGKIFEEVKNRPNYIVKDKLNF